MSEAMSPEFMQTMQQNMMMAGDTTLQVLFTPEQYELVGKAVKENLMADIAMLAKMKPAFITQQLTLILCMKHLGGFNPQEQLDTYFQQQAIQSGKKVGGLETPISQINVLLNSQTLQRQANLLYCLVSDIDKAMDQTKRLNNAYKDQYSRYQRYQNTLEALAMRHSVQEFPGFTAKRLSLNLSLIHISEPTRP